MWALYNNYTKQYLNHPSIGTWNTNDFKEAEEMKQSCIAMLKEIHYDFMIEHIEIVELET